MSPAQPHLGPEGAWAFNVVFVLGAALPFAMELDKSSVSEDSVTMRPALEGLPCRPCLGKKPTAPLQCLVTQRQPVLTHKPGVKFRSSPCSV